MQKSCKSCSNLLISDSATTGYRCGLTYFGQPPFERKMKRMETYPLIATRFSRTDENEADRMGLELSARAGYDPRAGVTLWQKMLKANSGGSPPCS